MCGFDVWHKLIRIRKPYGRGSTGDQINNVWGVQGENNEKNID